MIAFDVFLNRKKLARAGVGTDGVLTAMTTWVRRRTPRTRGKRPQWYRDLRFDLSGYRSTNGGIGTLQLGRSQAQTWRRSDDQSDHCWPC